MAIKSRMGIPQSRPQTMNPFDPLTDAEFDELDQFLLNDVHTEEVMTIDMLDGFLHAIAIGPVTVSPKQWLPKVWGTEGIAPPVESIDQLNHVLGLVMRHYNSIISGLEQHPAEVSPSWAVSHYRGKEYDTAEGWAFGFVDGMKLCWSDWEPMLFAPEGRRWFRPIGLLGSDDYSEDQDQLTRTPAQRAKLTLEIPEALLNMYAYWLPLRQAVHEGEMAKALQPKIGRNDPCHCGSGKKFKKCCGAPTTLH